MCGDGCIKYLLFTFNFIFSLIGVALIVVGSLLLSDTSSFSDLVSDVGSGLKTPQIFLIAVGIVIFFIATLGCCGAIRESRCLLITFAIMLLIIFVLQLAIGIYALTHKTEFKSSVEKGLSEEFNKIQVNPNTKRLFYQMEKDWECCGVRGFSDYLTRLLPVPDSCCSDKSKCTIKRTDYWRDGCADAITNFTGKAGEILGGVAIALSAIEVIGALFALRLASQVK